MVQANLGLPEAFYNGTMMDIKNISHSLLPSSTGRMREKAVG